MSQDQDDLEYNKFYHILTTQFQHIYKDAQRRCHTICIPVSQALSKVESLSQEFINVHILQPSPFFKGQYLTSDKSKRTLVLENNIFTLRDGFKVKDQIKVISEELGYNKELKPFKFLWIERPFITPTSMKSPVGIEEELPVDNLHTLDPTYDQCQKYLQKFPACHQALEMVQRESQQLSDNYMVLPGFLDEVAEKVKSIWTELCEIYLQNLSVATPELARDSRVKNNIEKSVESCLLGRLHEKLFPVIQKECLQEDSAHCEKLSLLKGLPPEALGVNREYSCPLSSPIQTIRELPRCRSPLELLLCLRQTFDGVTQSVNEHLCASSRTGGSMLNTDDYISLLLYVLAQAGCNLPLGSIEYYISNYHWTSSYTDHISYSYVTFQAVLRYLSTLNTHKLLSEHQSSKAVQAEKEPITPSDLSSTPVSRQSRRDRRMERITRMLEKSTTDFVEASQESLPPRVSASVGHPHPALVREKQAATLGSFLSSLSEDSGPSFGKQT